MRFRNLTSNFMLQLVRIVWIVFLSTVCTELWAQQVNCVNVKCVPVSFRIVNGGTVNPQNPVVPTPSPNLQNGTYPYGTTINFSTPIGLATTNGKAYEIEYRWGTTQNWQTGSQATVKNSGDLYIRGKVGTTYSEIVKFTYNVSYSKVLLVGNSITQHGPYEPIGWSGNWGMAASAADKDYKSVLEGLLKTNSPTVQTNIFPTARIENDFTNYDFGQAQRDYGTLFATSDLIIIRLGENNKDWEIPGSTYKATMLRYINMIKQLPNARVVITSTFWEGFPNTNTILKEIAQENGYDWVSLEEIGKDSSNYAYGLFTDPAVAKHPNDKGMKAIADLIFEKVK